jgi:hypothetical protein
LFNFCYFLRTKKFSCFDEKKTADGYGKTAKTFIRQYVRDNTLIRAGEDPDSPSPALHDKRLRFFDAECLPVTRYNPRSATLEDEFRQYLSTPVDPNVTALQFWKTNWTYFPVLAKVARRLFCYQATSVASERIFSKSDITITDRRAALSSKRAEKVLIVQQAI